MSKNVRFFFLLWHRVNIITQVVVKKGLEGRPVGLRVSLYLCLEEQRALPAAVADCFLALLSVSATNTIPSGAAPPERGNEGERVRFICWVWLWLTREYSILQTPVCLRRWIRSGWGGIGPGGWRRSFGCPATDGETHCVSSAAPLNACWAEHALQNMRISWTYTKTH